MNKVDFNGLTVLITGASSGIGEAFARNLAGRGANLILTARSEDKLTRIADELKTKHAISVHVFPGDLGSIEAPQQLVINAPAGLASLTAEFERMSHDPDVLAALAGG